MITMKQGDLLQATEKVIAHQVNCHGVAGGLSAAVFRKYPVAENDYLQIIDRVQNAGGQGRVLLGMAQCTGQQKDGHIVCNLYGQFYPGADYRPDELEMALKLLGEQARTMGWSVALPWRLSSGICGGDWDEVQQIIERTMVGVDCAIYRREGDE